MHAKAHPPPPSSSSSPADSRTPKRILLTGGCGFIGSNLVHWLLHPANPDVAGALEEVVVLDNLTHGSCVDNIRSLLSANAALSLEVGDYGDIARVESLLREHAIDCVMHLGGETNVDRSFADPRACMLNNVDGTRKLLEACRDHPALRTFMLMSTDEIYGDERQQPSAETDTPRPTNPYAASKVAAEAYATADRSAYGTPVVTVRCNNVYGPMQTRDKVVPLFLDRIAAGGVLALHGGGGQTRTWVHAEDVCAALWQVVCRGRIGEVYNIGSRDEIAVVELARRLHAAAASIDPAVAPLRTEAASDRPHNDQHYRIDWAKIRRELGWAPAVPFDVGLRRAASWYAARRSGGGATPEPGFLFARHAVTIAPSPSASPRVLLFGARGWIGGKLAALMRARGVEVVEAKTRPADHPDSAVRRELAEVSPTHVMCAIGRTHGPGCDTIDYLEGGPARLRLNIRDNLDAPLVLANLCAERGVRMARVGTGCIFDRPAGPVPEGETGYVEGDDPDYFGSSYSVVQGATDRQLRYHAATVLNARVRMPVDADLSPRNFVPKIASYARVIDVPNSVTALPELLPWFVQLALEGVTGTLNFVNEGTVSHNQVLEMYREAVDPAFVVRNFTVEEQGAILKAGRCNCRLDASELGRLIAARGGRLQTAEEAVRGCIAAMAGGVGGAEAVREFVAGLARARGVGGK
jgi:dTDP-glucose 4,6-dehydratase